MIEVTESIGDDEKFCELVSNLMNREIAANTPDDVYLVQIDHWFDDKWYLFAGKILGALGRHSYRLTVPPFDPNRVVSERHYHREVKSGPYFESAAKALHGHRWSSLNLSRYVEQITKSGVFVWYSGNTLKDERGSIMIYRINDDKVGAWYASYVKKPGWSLNKFRGISRSQLIQMAA